MINKIEHFSEFFLKPTPTKDILKYTIPISTLGSLIMTAITGLIAYFSSSEDISFVQLFIGFIIFTAIMAFVVISPIYDYLIDIKAKEIF